ncbi:MAG: hypothetical protein IH789_10525 [Acidobacteria bacterium]|nr:hypothetical protein [Acidobacteriota bacterium]
MRKIGVFLAVVSMLLLAVPAVAQDDGGNIVAVHCNKVQPGTEAKYEEGWKKHVDWHRKQNDSWTWLAWQVITGPDSGTYCTGSFGHNWEDFDKPRFPADANLADIAATFGPFVREHELTFWTALPDVSNPSEGQAAMDSVIFFNTRYGTEEKFNHLIGEFHKAIEKTNMPWNYEWYALVSGGNEGTYALVLPRPNFAAFNPTGKPFPKMLEEAYGKAGADALLAKWRKVVKSANSELSRSRPDLSYIPAGQ